MIDKPSWPKSCFFPVFLVFPLLWGCGLLEKRRSAGHSSKKAIATKTDLAEKKTWKQIQSQKNISWRKKIKDIEAFIQSHKSPARAGGAYLLKAKILLNNGKPKEACLSYHQAAQSSSEDTIKWEALSASAKCHVQEGRLDLALETLESLIQNPKSNLKDKKASAQTQWSWLKSKNALIKRKLLSLSHLFFLSSRVEEKRKWRDQGERLIQNLSPGDLILSVNQAENFGVFEGYLLYRAGKYFIGQKKFSKARRYFKRSLSASLPLSLKKEAQHYLMMIKKSGQVNPYLIGAIAPLSGRRKALGEKVLRGLYMGLGLEKNSPWQIAAMDSKSHPDVIQAQLDELFYKRHIIGLVGGFTRETASALAKRAEAFAVPSILFSQKRDLSLNREFVFQNAIQPEQLLKPLVNRAIKALKVKKAALLRPDDFYGEEYAKTFSQLFQEAGGQIIKHEVYKAGEVDFKKHIVNLLDLRRKGREKEFAKLKKAALQERPSLSERSRKLTPENLLQPKKEFSALFIPDSLNQALKIKNHLKYFGVKEVYLMGTDLWRPRQVSYWSKDLPLVFINLPKKDSSLNQKSLFYKEFVSLYGHPPGIFEQRAYNAGAFLKQALERGAKNRLSLQRELKQIRAFQGAHHKISVSKDGIFKYPLNVYKTSRDKAHILDSMPVK